MCAAPRADHLLCTLPPDLSASYARGHDDAVWQCLRELLGEPDDQDPARPASQATGAHVDKGRARSSRARGPGRSATVARSDACPRCRSGRSPASRLRRIWCHAARRSTVLDVTLVSPLTRDGRPQPSSTTRDGAALAIAERRKRAAYPEFLRRGPQRLCVLACEIGGRWNDESLRLGGQLVRSRALRAPAPLRGAATQGWYRRWWGLLSVAVQNTLAATLLGSPPVHAPMPDAQAPTLQDVLHDACPPVPSCLPAR